MKKIKFVIKRILKTLGLYKMFLKMNNFVMNSNPKENDDIATVSDIYPLFVKKGDTCFDVGANLGIITDVLLRLGSRVISAEPQISCVKVLKERFASNPDVVIVDKALGEHEGREEISICEDAPTISTMSNKWRDRGRFSEDYEWEKKQSVEVTTLDKLIEKYGTPKFCKIDVEGFELQVLKGLSKKIPFISFEFTKEFFDDAKACIQHVLTIGSAKFNCTLHDSKNLVFPDWVSSEELIRRLESEKNALFCGDIYVKMD